MNRWLHETKLQFEWLRFIAVGIKSTILYCLFYYVLLSLVGVDPKTAVTVIFFLGAAYSFWFNKRFVFKNRAAALRQIVRYFLIYFAAWLLNLFALEILLNGFGVNSYLAQAILVLPFAVLIFSSLKYLVFQDNAKLYSKLASSLQSGAREPIETR
jgi:putative flippase GtrA